MKLSVTDRSHDDAVIRKLKLTERKPLFNIAHSQRFNGEVKRFAVSDAPMRLTETTTSSGTNSARSMKCFTRNPNVDAAIAIAPATRPATPATNTLLRVPCAAATPSTKLAVETMPSFAPNTAARGSLMRPVRCSSF